MTTDRIFPGSSINSFLQHNGQLVGLDDGGTKRLEDVASVSDEEKTQLIEPVGTVPVTSKDAEDVLTETYTCPCKKKSGSCGGSGEEVGNGSAQPAKDIKEVWSKFTSPVQKDTFSSGRKPRNVIETLDKVAEDFKHTLTGGKNKNAVEGFCNEHWHEVSTSIIIVIVIVFITLAIYVSLTLIKITEKCCKKCCKNGCCGDKVAVKGGFGNRTLSGGAIF